MSDHTTQPTVQVADAKGRMQSLARQLSGPVPGHGAVHSEADDWDPASAEALMQAYEGQAPTVYYADPPPAPVARQVQPPRQMPSAAAFEPRTAAARPAAPASPAVPYAPAAPVEALATLAQDRVWLEGRFNDLAARLEETMHRLDPAEQIAPLAGRIDGLEQHLRTALDDVVRKDAFAGLEMQIGDVRQQLETARGKLDRLDGIEAKLGVLAEFAAAANEAPAVGAALPADLDISALLNAAVDQTAQRFARDAKPAFDIDALVDRTAARTAERIAASPMPAAPAEGMSELRSLVSGYVDEYRREQSQTAAALATMQEALVSLIDRIDQYDETAQQEMPAEQPAAPAPAFILPEPARPDMRKEQFVEVGEERGTRPGRRATDAAAPIPAAPEVPSAPTAQRAPRRGPATTPAPAPEAIPDAADAAEALAAERIRVAAERAAQAGLARRAPRAPDPVQSSPEPEMPAEPAAEPKPRATRKVASGGSGAARGLKVAGFAAVVIGASAFAHLFMSGRFGAVSKMDERVPAASAGAKMTPRPSAVAVSPQGTPTVPLTLPSQPASVGSNSLGAATPQPALPIASPGGATDGPRILSPSAGVAPIAPMPQPRTPQVQPAPQPQPTPQVAPQPSSNALPDAFKPKSVPETVNDDLQSNARPGGLRASPAAMSGITLDNSGMPSPAELARRMANPATSAAPQTGAQPISTGATAPADASTTIETPRNGSVELPPAAIGPSSLRAAAQQGDPGAQFEVAARFAEGKGIKQDFQQAITWYSRASQKGFVPAQYRLATLYERGLGTPADITRAKVWYRRAADQGHIKSMHNLAVLAAGPQQAEPDYATAVRWFTEAADRGLADSQFNLGVLAENGLGMQKDAQQAYKWFALAARSGDKEATRRRDQLAATFNPEQARSAEQLVGTWRAKPTEVKANDPRSAAQAWAAERDAAALAAQRQAEQRQASQQVAPMPPPPPAAAPPKAKPAKVTSRTQ